MVIGRKRFVTTSGNHNGTTIVEHAHLVAILDALFLGKFFAHLDELRRHGLDEGRAQTRLAAGLPMLGHRVRGRDDRVIGNGACLVDS